MIDVSFGRAIFKSNGRPATAAEPAGRGLRENNALRSDTRQSAFLAYSVAIVSVGLAALCRWALEPVLGPHYPFPTFYLAVLLTPLVRNQHSRL